MCNIADGAQLVKGDDDNREEWSLRGPDDDDNRERLSLRGLGLRERLHFLAGG